MASRAPILLMVVMMTTATRSVRSSSSTWCMHGTILRGEKECLCTREGEDSCVGAGCGAGHGVSFYPRTCRDCACVDPRGERKKEKISRPQPSTTTIDNGNDAIEDLEAYMNWRNELKRGRGTTATDNKTILVTSASVAVAISLTLLLCCLRGTKHSMYIVQIQ